MKPQSEFDIRHALCFVAVVREKSFTGAAERLGLTQPAVSGVIAKLESQLGFPLFVRPSRRVQLTSKGEAFLLIAQRIVEVNTEAQEQAQALRAGHSQRLRVGAPFQSIGIPERSELFESFISHYPGIGLEIVHGMQPELLQWLDRGEVEVVLLIRPFDETGLKHMLIHRSIGHLLVPVEHPLAKLSGLRHSDLAGHAMVATARHVAPSTYDHLYAPFARAGAIVISAPESVDHEMERFARLRRLIHLRFGLGAARRKVFGDMIRLPLLGEPLLLEYSLAQRDKQSSAGARALWNLAGQIFKEDGTQRRPAEPPDAQFREDPPWLLRRSAPN